MSIVATEIELDTGPGRGRRMVFYRCRDHVGAWHEYGPVQTIDPSFDAEAYKPVVAAKVAASLARAEAREVLSNG